MTTDPDMLNFDIIEKGLGVVSPPYFVYDFSRIFFPCYISLIDQIFRQFVYYNCSLKRLWKHKFWNEPYLSNQAIFLLDQKINTKT